jgi:hypothetical protein
MTDIRYSSEELTAFTIADKLSDGIEVPVSEVLKALLEVTHSSYQSRRWLERARWGLVEKNKIKRENIKKLIEMEQNSS